MPRTPLNRFSGFSVPTLRLSLPYIRKPNQKPKNRHRHNQRSPEKLVLTNRAYIDQNHPQPIKSVQQKKQQQQNINRRVEMQLSR